MKKFKIFYLLLIISNFINSQDIKTFKGEYKNGIAEYEYVDNGIDREFIEKYEDKWNWYNLSSNKSLPWSLELIEKYKDKWNWYSGLSSNKNLPWSINLIHKYSDKFESSEYLWNTLKPYINEEMVIELLEEIKNKSNGRNENSRKINN
uniref:hypothetical protein n=1 Tax=Flavobacterium sp. TaxID=239 RepID=UPI004048D47B